MQIHDLVGHHAAMQTQVLVAVQRGEDRGRQLADADLDAIAILDQAGDLLADPLRLLGWRAGLELDQGMIGRDHDIEPLIGHEPAVRRPRHGGVDLGDHEFGAIQHRGHEMHRGPEAALAIASGGVTWIRARSTGRAAR